MVDKPPRTFQELCAQVGSYPEDAFLFVREGLSYAVESIHGPESEVHHFLQQHLAQHDLDWVDLAAKYHAGELADAIKDAIDSAGGCEKLNRHVGGRELCWALRDYAVKRWGLLARTVLDAWNIRETRDFGRIVFGFIEFDLMRKQEADRREDFDDVYRFEEAFDIDWTGDSDRRTKSFDE